MQRGSLIASIIKKDRTDHRVRGRVVILSIHAGCQQASPRCAKRTFEIRDRIISAEMYCDILHFTLHLHVMRRSAYRTMYKPTRNVRMYRVWKCMCFVICDFVCL